MAISCRAKAAETFFQDIRGKNIALARKVLVNTAK
jgi:hypothetical protein